MWYLHQGESFLNLNSLQTVENSFQFFSEMPFRGHHHHQPPEQLGEGHNPSLLAEFLQAPPPAHPESRRGAWSGRDQWDWKIDCSQDSRWQVEAQSGSIQGILNSNSFNLNFILIFYEF